MERHRPHPAVEELCQGIGIRTWFDLATTEASLLRTMLVDAGPRFSTLDPSLWPEMARMLAGAEWQEFKELSLGVDSNDSTGDARRFVNAHGITYPVVSDPHGLVAANRYDVAGLPVTYVIDPRGRVVGGRVLGPISDKAFATDFARDLHAARTW